MSNIRSREAVAIIAALGGNTAAARLAWSKYDEAERVVSSRVNTAGQIRTAEHAIHTLDSQMELERRIGKRDPEKESRLSRLLEEIARLKRDERAHEEETLALAKKAGKLQLAAKDATERAIDGLRARMGTMAVLLCARSLGIETPHEWERIAARQGASPS